MVSKRGLHHIVNRARVREAIVAAERSTSAAIHVSIAPYFWGDVRRTAERAFRKLGLARTLERNGVLLFVVPSRREFAVIGDVSAHERLGQRAWDSLAEVIAEHFHREDPTRALELGIGELGLRLAQHFPATDPVARPSHQVHRPA